MTDSSKPHVLVVEDNETVAETYATFLGDTYGVTIAYDGDDALEVYDESVDVVLLDRRMPRMSGDDVLQQLRARDADVRVVVVTAVTPELDIVDLPFDAYVVKPVERDELRAIVEVMLDRTDYEDDLQEFLALASTRATLELERNRAELDGSTQYQYIKNRMASLREDLGVETERLETLVSKQPPSVDTDDAVVEE
ncbi:response regulator [Haloarculaceae archaeon H-GB2-1]|nr:response regulator [Haloarculaceae archaeon H-GB1-1]MEA5387041.1 response regulator [Haloarculaceae archaeon H-GB11]MEA5408544.1 response regulator [Haloarculaceae archaeon H-GB2-1]